jgi:catechol-2,3-dioxygenase
MKIIDLKLKTNVLEKMKKFYLDILHIPILEDSMDSFTLQIGKSRLKFERFNGNTNYHFAFSIPKNKLLEAKKWLSQRVEILSNGGEQIS